MTAGTTQNTVKTPSGPSRLAGNPSTINTVHNFNGSPLAQSFKTFKTRRPEAVGAAEEAHEVTVSQVA